MRLLLASLLATVFAVASAQQEDAVLRLVASERTPVVWRHRDLGRTAVEVVGSGDVLAPGRGTATVTVLATPQGGARTITLALAVVDPASGAESVVVGAAGVDAPLHVRYAYENVPLGANLYNRAGLPAAPFRSDP